MLSFCKQNIIIIYIPVLLFFLTGCGGFETTAEKVFGGTNNEGEEIECPGIDIVKDLDSYVKEDKNKEISYIVKFNNVGWQCDVEYTEPPSLIENIFDDNDDYVSEFIIKISMNISFIVSTSEEVKIGNIETFPYVIVLLDKENNIIVKKSFNVDFRVDSTLDTFIIEDDLIKISVANQDINKKNNRLLIGFINR